MGLSIKKARNKQIFHLSPVIHFKEKEFLLIDLEGGKVLGRIWNSKGKKKEADLQLTNSEAS